LRHRYPLFKDANPRRARIKLSDGDEVVSLSLLAHGDGSAAEARAYLRQASARERRKANP